MTQKLFALTTLIAALAMGGCASVPLADKEANREAKAFALNPGLANIYVYRTDSIGSAIAMPILLDGVVIGKTAKKTFLLKQVHPGRHTIVSRTEVDVKLDVVTAAGQNYFVWQEIKLGSLRAGSELHLVDDATGKKGVKKCALID
jgi:Protein of unknown function (DUF2846)